MAKLCPPFLLHEPGEQAAGLDEIIFPATVSAGDTYTQDGAYTATMMHTYTLNASTNVNGSYAITIADRAGNETTVPFSIYADHISPTVTPVKERQVHRPRAPDHDPPPGTVVGGGNRLRHPWLATQVPRNATWRGIYYLTNKCDSNGTIAFLFRNVVYWH
jgi:hypothetical protein